MTCHFFWSSLPLPLPNSNLPSHYCCNSSRCCEKMPPRQQQEQHNQRHRHEPRIHFGTSISCCWRKLLNLLGETLQLLVLCHSAAPGVPGELQRPMRQTWRRGRGQWQPPSPEEIPWVSLFPIAMDRWPSPKNSRKHKKSNFWSWYKSYQWYTQWIGLRKPWSFCKKRFL